jgi:photosystem II stability/assembly factor-like uncharacterized protein
MGLLRLISKPVITAAIFAFLLSLIDSSVLFAQTKPMELVTTDAGWFLNQGKLYWTSDNGTRWRDITPVLSLAGERIADVYFKDMREGWVLLSTDENHGPEATFELASTTDSGASWRISPISMLEPGPPRRPALPGDGFVFFLDSVHGWLNLSLESSQNFSLSLFLETQDGGHTWERKVSPGSGSVRFSTSKDGWIAGGPGEEHLYSTNDAGAHWQDVALQIPPETGGKVGLYSLPTFYDRQHGFVSVKVAFAATAVLFETNDAGQSWKANRIITDSAFEGHEAPLPSVVLDSDWVIAKGEDSLITILRPQRSFGSTSTEKISSSISTVPSTGPTFSSVLDLSFISREHGWILFKGRLYTTANAGVEWKDVTPGSRPTRA